MVRSLDGGESWESFRVEVNPARDGHLKDDPSAAPVWFKSEPDESESGEDVASPPAKKRADATRPEWMPSDTPAALVSAKEAPPPGPEGSAAALLEESTPPEEMGGQWAWILAVLPNPLLGLMRHVRSDRAQWMGRVPRGQVNRAGQATETPVRSLPEGSGRLPEEMLVALGVIRHFNADWIANDLYWKALCAADFATNEQSRTEPAGSRARSRC